MKYEYKTHAVYRGYGWIEPLTDSEDSLIEDYLARRICEELNTLQAECERLREQLRLATVDQATAEAEANDARAEVEAMREAFEEILSRSCMNLAMNPNPYELTALLGDIHQIAGAALAQESGND